MHLCMGTSAPSSSITVASQRRLFSLSSNRACIVCKLIHLAGMIFTDFSHDVKGSPMSLSLVIVAVHRNFVINLMNVSKWNDMCQNKISRRGLIWLPSVVMFRSIFFCYNKLFLTKDRSLS